MSDIYVRACSSPEEGLTYQVCDRDLGGSFRVYTKQDLCQVLAEPVDYLRIMKDQSDPSRAAAIGVVIETMEKLVGTNTCVDCDCTGDVHSIIGEWRGECQACRPNEAWVKNIEYLLKRSKHTIRMREGGGPESLLDSLIVTFMAMEEKLKEIK